MNKISDNIKYMDQPIPIIVRGRAGKIVGELDTPAGKFYAIDFGDKELGFVRADDSAELHIDSKH
jgi:hypothetical protein